MKKFISFLRRIFRKKKKWYGFEVATFKFKPYRVGVDPFAKEDPMNGFAMIIPKEAIKINEMVEDVRGAPVYAPCPAKGGLCACTGACRRIIEYTKDPVKLSAHRQYIANYNSFQKSQMQNFQGERKWDDNTQIWETKKPQG